MKKIIYLLASLALLSSCGGGGGYEKNEFLGEIPYIYQEIGNQLKELEQKATEKQKPEIYIEGAKELEAQKIEDVTNAFTKIKGNELPFAFKNGVESDLFEVKSVKIDNINAKTGAMTLLIDCRAKKSHITRRVKFSYAVVNSDGKARTKLTINPYAKTFNATGMPAKTIKTGEQTNGEGIKVMIYPESYDLTDFSSIQFSVL